MTTSLEAMNDFLSKTGKESEMSKLKERIKSLEERLTKLEKQSSQKSQTKEK